MLVKHHLRRITKGGGVPDRDPKSEKYYVSSCQSRINKTTPSTEGWIEVVKAFKKVAKRDIDLQKSQILLSNMLDQNIVVKIGNDDTIKKEYDMGKLLQRVKGFVKFICYFECEDDFYEYFTRETGHMCRGVGDTMRIILMPYFPLGDIAHHPWTVDNVPLLKSCLQIACLSLCDAYEKKGFVHGDFHPGNVMMKATKQASVVFDNISIKTNGVRPWIMDFENSKVDPTRSDMSRSHFFFDLRKMFMLLTTFVRELDITGVNAITKDIMLMEEMSGMVNKERLCVAIDTGIAFGSA